MLLIYKNISGNRIDYAMDVLFKHILGVEYNIIQDVDAFKSSQLPKINYSEDIISDAINIYPSTELWNDEITKMNPEMINWNDLPVFFKTKQDLSIPFDPFAMIFFLLSRYEEYVCEEFDQHARFRYVNSHAYLNDYLHLPLVNIIANELLRVINQEFKSNIQSAASYSFQPTFDIDIAYAHTGKGMLRAMAAFLKLMAKADQRAIRQRLNVNFGKQRDPYDNFGSILEILEKYKLKGTFFILIGDYGKYDKNVSYRNSKFRELIKHLSDYAEIGLHPSYGSFNNPEKIKKEKKRLEDITGKEVTKSRQHFLRMRFPETYNCLIDAGIKHDYSMGYANTIGFRAGVCTPYPFFDLKENKPKDLMIHPFEFMDTAVMGHMKVKAGDFIQTVETLIDNTKEVNGKLSGIWHNYDLSDNIEKHNTFVETINECIK